MRLLLDEHFSPRVALQLREQFGHDAVDVGSVGMLGAPDDLLLERAVDARRAVVTEDVADFMKLHSQWLQTGRHHYGLVLTPGGRFHRGQKNLGPLISALDLLLKNSTDEDSLKNQVHWLSNASLEAASR